MATFQLTNDAEMDMADIGRYTEAQWGRDQRIQYLTELDDSFHLLADAPGMGEDCNYIRAGYRKHPVGRHLVFYRSVAADRIEIVRILHERMDVDRHLPTS